MQDHTDNKKRELSSDCRWIPKNVQVHAVGANGFKADIPQMPSLHHLSPSNMMMDFCRVTHSGSKSPVSTEESSKNKIQQTKRDKQRKRFECPVCYEYMEDPFGCGNVCRSRFCHPCLRWILPRSSRFIVPQSIHFTICGL